MTDAVGRRPGRGREVAVGVVVGISVWISLGAVAVVDPDRVTRVGALPSWGWLAGAVLGATLLAVIGLRSRQDLTPLSLLALVWLPWVPARVPASFLLWDGPLEAAIWAAALVGAVWPHLRRLAPDLLVSLARAPRGGPWMAAALTAALALAAWTRDRALVPAGDEPHYLVIAESLIRDGDLRIENNHADGSYLQYVDTALAPDFRRRGIDGEIYSIHAPGLPFLVAPAFALAGYAGAALTIVGLSALGMAAAWRAAFVATGAVGAAWFATLAVLSSTPFLFHAFTLFPDGAGAALITPALLALVAVDCGRPPTRTAWFAVGTTLAALPWLHSRFAIVAGVLGGVLALRVWWSRDGGWKGVASLLAVPVVSAAAWLAFFWTIYGTPSPAAPYGGRPEGGLSFLPTGLTGLLVDQQFGLGVVAPVLVIGLLACVWLAAHRRRLAIELLVVIAGCVATVATFPMWWGGHSAPARFLVVILPLLVVPLAHAWARASAPARRGLLALLTLSMLTTTALVSVERGAFAYNDRDGFALLFDWVTRSVDLTLALPSVHRDGAGVAALDGLAWIAAGALTAAIAARAASAGWTSAARVAGWLATPAAVMLASTVVWTSQPREVVTAATSQVSWLDRWPQPRPSLVGQLAPLRRLDPTDAPSQLRLGTSTRGSPRPPRDPLLFLPQVPAGDYDVVVEGRVRLAGDISVRLGRHDGDLETWSLEGRPSGQTGLRLRLPVDASSITIRGNPAARAAVRRVTLRPYRFAPAGPAPRALRAGRFGRVAVYALDDNAFLESGAIWVRGERAARFVLSAEDGPPIAIRLAAGAVANEIELRAGTWRRRVRLAPSAEADVVLPDESLAPATLTVTSTTGFRPSADGRGDVRRLGVYVTWPVATPAGTPAPPR